jgi:hypothetical protein
VGREPRGRDDGGNVNNVQYKPNWELSQKILPINKYIITKIYSKKNSGYPSKSKITSVGEDVENKKPLYIFC